MQGHRLADPPTHPASCILHTLRIKGATCVCALMRIMRAACAPAGILTPTDL